MEHLCECPRMHVIEPVTRPPSRIDRAARRAGFAGALLLASALAISIAAPVRADAALTGAVAASYFPRTVDAGLQAIAQQRAAEISCSGCFNHSGMRAGTAEVIAYNFGHPDPVAAAVAGWRSSPPHNSILSNASLGRIGCARTAVGGSNFLVCVLASGPLPAVPASAAGPAAAAPAGGGAAGPAGATRTAGGAVAAALPDTATSQGR